MNVCNAHLDMYQVLVLPHVPHVFLAIFQIVLILNAKLALQVLHFIFTLYIFYIIIIRGVQY